MKVLVASHRIDVHVMIMGRYLDWPTPTTVHDCVNVVSAYITEQPDLVIVDKRDREMTEAVDRIRAYEERAGIKPVSVQYVTEAFNLQAGQCRLRTPRRHESCSVSMR